MTMLQRAIVSALVRLTVPKLLSSPKLQDIESGQSWGLVGITQRSLSNRFAGPDRLLMECLASADGFHPPCPALPCLLPLD